MVVGFSLALGRCVRGLTPLLTSTSAVLMRVFACVCACVISHVFSGERAPVAVLRLR